MARQTFIDESVGLSRLHGEIVQTLATLSIDRGDKELRDALALHGITVRDNAGTPASPAAAGSPRGRAVDAR